ncbi:hypothetical protein EIP91_006697 [Steccherinum ochraceum]|uniref:Transcription-associated protein 1 n=1 Tax=Steccherinum ochraceum TaxID=92696 RepID=A0A4R0RLS5_9APHY|nr:hypothetical protein EIP91_006697 [Steccherinum ochraceum]
MEGITPPATASDLESKAARVADPSIDLKTKLAVATELRDLIDSVRDSEAARVIPQMIPVLLEVLKSGTPSTKKDSVEYAFRRVLVDVVHRIPLTEAVRPQAVSLLQGMMHLIRIENEEIGILCCKVVYDAMRTFKTFADELASDLMKLHKENVDAMEQLAVQYLDEGSKSLEASDVLMSINSCRVLGELTIIVGHAAQLNRNVPQSEIISNSVRFVLIESPAQKKAREDYEAMGNVWAGVAPTVPNVPLYTDFLSTQIKALNIIAVGARQSPEQTQTELETAAVATVRVMQDLPANAAAARRDVLICLRNLFVICPKKAFVSQIDKMFDERVVFGSSSSMSESLKVSAVSILGETIVQLKADVSPMHLSRICGTCLRHFHNPYHSTQLYGIAAKVILSTVDLIVVKETHQAAARLLTTILESFVEKLEAMAINLAEMSARIERRKASQDPVVDAVAIEKARGLTASTMSDRPEEVILEHRPLFRAVLLALRHTLAGLRKCDAPVPDGSLIARLLEAAVCCTSPADSESRESSELMEILGSVLGEVNLHVFQEVWTQKVGFIFENSKKRPSLYHLCQFLILRETTSPTLVAIMLRFLLDRLHMLGDYDTDTAAFTIRLFKLVFTAVGHHPGHNEHLLAAHLGKLIMDCFPLIATATRPDYYHLLLKALFRAIGGGGGRFELIYKEVLPLLPDMLDGLTRQLNAPDGTSRDMAIELCLTVPLRLTHLLPYLSYLMRPLTMALRGNHELVSQGLRTLELCIDNLTADFLDPTLNTVLRDLTEALQTHLRPSPASHSHAHTTIRLLGKLGGRNRRLLTKEPSLQYTPHAEPVKVRVTFGGASASIELGHIAALAFTTLSSNKVSPSYRQHAFDYLQHCLNLIIIEGIRGREREDVLIKCLEGVFDAIYIPEFQEVATKYVRDLTHHVFATEIRKSVSKEDFLRRNFPSALFAAYLDALPHGIAREKAADEKTAHELMATLIQDVVSLPKPLDITNNDVTSTFHQFASRLSSLCLDSTWTRKSAGCTGIKLLATTPDLGVKWINDREVDLMRTLLHVLKDMPYDLARDVDLVVDTLVTVLTVSEAELSTTSENAVARNKLMNLTGILFAELSGSNPVVRRVAQQCVQLLVKLSGKTASELLLPHRERMLTAIYTKPLRALPFPIQIGMIEAVRYCLGLEPPLPELNDELLRLLHESLALADAEDGALIGRNNPRQAGMEIVKLRVSCIKLLTASMPLTDFFSKHPQTRQRWVFAIVVSSPVIDVMSRVTSVYFKSLYSPTPEVKEVAHEGLRMVLTHQSRLPKELLQTGLRPILMNLADPKRLSIPGLEGLARLLELLTNYFKVEIGHKLLDHFRIVADPQMLQASSRLPISENEGITKLVRLANIFHLLPAAANIFLENLVNAVVQTEAQLHFSGRSPFSEPLAKYLDRYPVEAIDFFFKHLHFPRHVRTLRSILQAKLAPNLLQELSARTPSLVSTCLEGRDPSLVLPGLMLCTDIADLVPGWLTEQRHVVDSIVNLWRPDPPEQGSVPPGEMTHRYSLMINIFMKALEQSPRVDLVYELLAIFAREHSLDIVRVTRFLYKHVALSESLLYRRNVLTRFCTWFEDKAYPWTHKTFGLRYILTPLIWIRSTQTPVAGLLGDDTVLWLTRHLWAPMIEPNRTFGGDDMFVAEVLHFTTIMVQHYHDLLADAKKDIIKLAWLFINSEDAIVKYSAHLLAAHFFAHFDTQPKFIISAWNGLLRPPPTEARHIARQAQDALTPALLQAQAKEVGLPNWAKQMRRVLTEEGAGGQQINYHYQLIIRQPGLFYHVRAAFVPHIVNHVTRLGVTLGATNETRHITIEILQIAFDWENKAAGESTSEGAGSVWRMPLAQKESLVSYLIRLCTIPLDPQGRTVLLPRALSLLRTIISHTGWSDVAFKLHFFLRALHQADLSSDSAIASAVSSAKVLNIIASDKPDNWYTSNADVLLKLVKKGMSSDEPALLDSLHPVMDRLLRLFPLTKEDEEASSEVSEIHSFVTASISEGLKGGAGLRGALMMLKSVVQAAPSSIESFASALVKLLQTTARDHLAASASAAGFESGTRQLIAMTEIAQLGIAYIADQRKAFIQILVQLVERSKSSVLCQYLLDMARDWALKRDSIPTMKEKAQVLKAMAAFSNRGERAGGLLHNFLELVYDIYTEPTLRRSELTVRLEQAFLMGCGSQDADLRERFIDLLDHSIPRSLFGRMSYILGVQNWDGLAEHNWIFLALHLLLGSIDGDPQILPDKKGSLETGLAQSPFTLGRISNLIRPIQRLLFLDPQAAHDAWVAVFPAAWACLSRREQIDVTHHLITLLAKDYHLAQVDMRPNVIHTLLEGAHACSPPMILPPHLIKYLAKNFGAWHIAMELLAASVGHVRDDEAVVRDTVYDSLAEVYAELAEEDMFYGVWRIRSLHTETNQALAFEQAGMWEQASNMYEAAQNKARAGVIPFSEVEYCLWEDHWMLAAEKLQHWDALYELARSESNHELMLESAWRTKDWAENKDSLEEQVAQLPDIATPRRRVFEAFIALLKLPAAMEKNTEFTRILEDAMQLSLRKWVTLPRNLSPAHVPLLQHFQQFVELQEAVQIFGSLSATNAQNLEKKSSDLKMVLQAWRERLPNQADDITIWSDLVAWRQNVFNAINKAYIPLISNNQQNGAAAGTTNTFGYRGFHETAWIINRFAHVARKHELLDVCFSSLNKIYTLPNIEISEAFLKLREQARCHYQKPGDLQAGLEVINNTNLMYFSTPQKAEFYTLKGMFYAKFGRNEEANQAFGSAVQLDMQQAKAWAAWGKYNDRLFKELPTEMAHAASAVSCYLQAAGLYKSSKSRPLLTRVLWLLSVDDGTFTISRAFDTYKGDAAFWYWITLIPQLCLSISQREVKQARYILLNLAKLYPQALFFHLRTTKDDMMAVKRQAAHLAAQQQAKANQAADAVKRDPDTAMQDATDTKPHDDSNASSTGAVNQGQPGAPNPQQPGDNPQYPIRQSWEYVEEVVQILKTAFPLLIMSMETIVEQINSRLKPGVDEDIYRLMCMLLQDAVQTACGRSTVTDDDGSTPQQTLATVFRLASNLQGQPRKDYEEDFIQNRPQQITQYIQTLQRWRDKYEKLVDSRPRIQPLDILSHYLTDFQYGKFDEIEVPGQYTEDKDSNQNFVRVVRFDPKFENCRTHGYSWRRLTIHGNDGSKTSFAVQNPSGRHCRREERTMQMFRTLNGALSRKKESRKRNLTFHIPAAIPCSPNLRLLQNDSSYVTFGDIFDQHCEEAGFSREDPTLLICEKTRSAMRSFRQTHGHNPNKPEYVALKVELFQEIQAKLVPPNVLTKYLTRTMTGPSELWRMRKQVALQIAACSFMTYVACLSSRTPQRFHLSRTTGLIAMSELLPGLSNQAPVLSSNDHVPFRFTPNMQHFLGPIMTEGLLTSGIVAIARSLTEPEYELEQQLCLFARDEYMTWLHGRGKPWSFDLSFRTNVANIVDGVVKKAETLACKLEREQAIANGMNNPNQNPVHQTVTALINTAMNTTVLVRQSEIFHAWY